MADKLITIAEARDRVLRAAGTLQAEGVPVADALDRVIAEDVRAAGDVPPFPSSAMDGYAIKAGAANRTLTVIGESRAGAPFDGSVGDGDAVRISTGAVVPDQATAVIKQEDVESQDTRIVTNAAVDPAENVRAAGEVITKGTMVLTAGTRISAAELAVAIAAGAGQVLVARRPRVEVLVTGDELREPGEPLNPGQIHNSNGPMLAALASRQGAATGPVGHLPDDRPATQAALEQAIDVADVVIVSGGVSVGPHDHVKPALAALGVEERFWGVALQPGKPTWFGTRGDTLVFGLPGNPVSAAVTFVLFVAPALARLQGTALHSDQEATLGTPMKRNPRREQAVRVRLERRDDITVAFPNGPQGSHVVTSLAGADALALIPLGEGQLESGTRVKLIPLPR
jgi:molybdopterin molybdotransferase